ncbi:MAG: hypothetical protein FJ088_01235, partial [Deltaproteobacteria bacterium]|nr:hypothetical protein [Deltaproteobacteria bacterium]
MTRRLTLRNMLASLLFIAALPGEGAANPFDIFGLDSRGAALSGALSTSAE